MATQAPTTRDESFHFPGLTGDIQIFETNLWTLVRRYWARRWLVAGVMLLFLVIAGLVLSQLTPRYTASISLMLDFRESNVVNIEAVLSGLPSNDSAISGEIEIMRSTRLLSRVVDKLHLTRDPEFNARLRPPTWRSAAVESTRRMFESLIEEIQPLLPLEWTFSRQEEEPSEAYIHSQVVREIRDALVVQQVKLSPVIKIEFTSNDAKKAALVANTLADQYLVDQLEAKYEATRRATSWLNDRLTDLKEQVATSEAAVERYRAGLGTGSGPGVELTTQQMTQLNSELILARTKRAEAEARYRQVADLVKSKGMNAAAEVTSSEVSRSLRLQLGEARRREAELATRYGDRHPKMINVRAEIQDTERAVEAEVKKVLQALQTELRVASSREATLAANLKVLERRSIGQKKASVELRQLEREAEANKLIYETFLARFKETQEQQDIQQADARVISKAETPQQPSYPKDGRTLLFTALLGLAAGLGLVFLLDRMDNAFSHGQQIESTLGLATLGNIPLIRGNRQRRDVLQYILRRPGSSLAESIRSLRTSLLLSNVDDPPQMVLLTSSVPREGKSTTALLLAETIAKLGRSVVLVDCDLRRPSLHHTLDVSNDTSLIEVLSHNASLEDALHYHEATGITLLPARNAADTAIDLLASKTFENCIAELKKNYDMIVVDAAPVLAVSDASVLAKYADALLYVIKWNSTPRDLVQMGIGGLRDNGVRVSGIVLAQINLKKQARYGYGGYGYYYGRYREYYKD